MPGRRRHSRKWDHCVQQVKRRGAAVDPYAVCTAALGELSLRKRARKKNPLSQKERLQLARHLAQHAELRKLKPYYIVTAEKSGRVLYLTPGNKFMARQAGARRFGDSRDAAKRARSLLHYYPHLKTYHVAVRVGY